MKKSRIPLILSLFALCACQGNNISGDTKPSENMPTETANRVKHPNRTLIVRTSMNS